jgi:hypothetical protein
MRNMKIVSSEVHKIIEEIDPKLPPIYIYLLSINSQFLVAYFVSLFNQLFTNEDLVTLDDYFEPLRTLSKLNARVTIQEKYDVHSIIYYLNTYGQYCLRIDSSKLYYSRDYGSNPKEHYILLTGYDLDKQIFYVQDNLQLHNNQENKYEAFTLSFELVNRAIVFDKNYRKYAGFSISLEKLNPSILNLKNEILFKTEKNIVKLYNLLLSFTKITSYESFLFGLRSLFVTALANHSAIYKENDNLVDILEKIDLSFDPYGATADTNRIGQTIELEHDGKTIDNIWKLANSGKVVEYDLTTDCSVEINSNGEKNSPLEIGIFIDYCGLRNYFGIKKGYILMHSIPEKDYTNRILETTISDLILVIFNKDQNKIKMHLLGLEEEFDLAKVGATGFYSKTWDYYKCKTIYRIKYGSS